nr:hypothetical protein Iba_chr02cCG6980 [Ipomoea batatas]
MSRREPVYVRPEGFVRRHRRGDGGRGGRERSSSCSGGLRLGRQRRLDSCSCGRHGSGGRWRAHRHGNGRCRFRRLSWSHHWGCRWSRGSSLGRRSRSGSGCFRL